MHSLLRLGTWEGMAEKYWDNLFREGKSILVVQTEQTTSKACAPILILQYIGSECYIYFTLLTTVVGSGR